MNGNWPRLLVQKNAAAYCDMAVAAFEREVLAGRLPIARMVGGKERWDRVALDRAIDLLMGNAESPAYLQKLRARYGEAA
jgi:hypothetical protein